MAPTNRQGDSTWELAHSLRNNDYLDVDKDTQAIIATEYGQENYHHKEATVKGNYNSYLEYLHNKWKLRDV